MVLDIYINVSVKGFSCYTDTALVTPYLWTPVANKYTAYPEATRHLSAVRRI